MKLIHLRNSWFKWISACVILGFSLLLIRTILPYFSMRPDVGFLKVKYQVLPLWHWRYAFYIHIFSSIPVILGGILQFWIGFMKRFPSIHRKIGQVYVFLILFVSAPSGLWMAFYAEGGFWGQFGLSMTAILWFIFTALAWKYALKKQFKKHADFMIRSYAMTLSAIIFRMGTFVAVAWLPMIHPDVSYAWITWLSWIPNLMIAEILIQKYIFSF